MRQVIQDVRKYTDMIRHDGLAHASRFGMLALRSRMIRKSELDWEQQRGLKFAKHLDLEHLEIGSANRVHGFSYGPSSSLSVRVLLSNVPEDFREFTFIDFGSGEGRALLAASSFPFCEIVGVEFAQILHEAATRNIKQVIGANEDNRIRSAHLDATEFQVPHRKCVLYFLNPFREAIFGRVLTNIERAHAECGEPMYVLYQQLREGLEAEKSANISLLRDSPYFEERRVRIPTVWDRFLLGSHQLNIFATKRS